MPTTYTEGNDTIKNTAANEIILALGGDDKITNSAGGVYIDAGAGDDFVRNSNSYVTIDGGAGNDLITLTSASGGLGVTVAGGTGDDTIYAYTDSGGRIYQYNLGDGNDVIYNISNNDELHIIGAEYTSVQSGSDLIFHVGEGNVTVKDAVGKTLRVVGDQYGFGKYISNSKSNTVVKGTNYGDTISNAGLDNDYVQLFGGDGDDSINNDMGHNSTLDGEDGNDTIVNSGSTVEVYGGAGNDFVQNKMSWVTIHGGTGNDSIENKGGNGIGYYTEIFGDDGDDYIYNLKGKDVTLHGGAGDDTIYSKASGASDELLARIFGDAGNDSIVSTSSKATIDSGDGSDTIEVADSWNNSIDAGAGDDLVELSNGKLNTVRASKGNDTIIGTNQSQNRYLYAAGDGSDTIEGFSSSDLLDIDAPTVAANDFVVKTASGLLAGNSYRVSLEGSDLVARVGTDKIVNKQTKDTGIQVVDNSGITLKFFGDENNKAATWYINKKTSAGTTIHGLEGNDTLKNEGATNIEIDAGDGPDSITNEFGGNNSTLHSGAGNDSIYNEGTDSKIYAGVGDNSVENHASNVEVFLGDGNNTVSNEAPSFSVHGGAGNNSTLHGGAGSDTIEAIYPIDISDGTSVIDKTPTADGEYIYGGGYLKGGDGSDRIICDAQPCILEADGKRITAYKAYALLTGNAGNDYLYMKNTIYSTLEGGDGSDTLANELHSHYTTLNGGKGDDLISINGALYNVVQYSSGDGNDVIEGFNATSMLQIGDGTYSTTKSGNDIIVKVGNSSVTLVDATALGRSTLPARKPSKTAENTKIPLRLTK